MRRPPLVVALDVAGRILVVGDLERSGLVLALRGGRSIDVVDVPAPAVVGLVVSHQPELAQVIAKAVHASPSCRFTSESPFFAARAASIASAPWRSSVACSFAG